MSQEPIDRKTQGSSALWNCRDLALVDGIIDRSDSPLLTEEVGVHLDLVITLRSRMKRLLVTVPASNAT